MSTDCTYVLFSRKKSHSLYFIMIAQNYYKVTQMTNLRRNLNDHFKINRKVSIFIAQSLLT